MTADTTGCAQAARVRRDPAASELDRRRAAAHLASCPLCRALTTADADAGADDPSHAVLQRLSSVRPAPRRALRVTLTVLGAAQAALSLPWLFGYNPLHGLIGGASTEHLTRDGALGVVLAVAAAVTVWRARYALPMLALCGAVLLMQLSGALVDEHGDHVRFHFEAVHVLGIAIAALIATCAGARERPPGPRRPSSTRALRNP